MRNISYWQAIVVLLFSGFGWQTGTQAMTDGQHTEPVPWKMNFFICSLLLLFEQQQNLFLVHKYMLFHSYDQFPMQKYDKKSRKKDYW